jgi:hypothetical protein
MNINTQFIDEVVNNFHRSLRSDGSLCCYSGTTPENANYNNEIYQKLYTLKYYPAYYFEYSCLATLLQDRLAKDEKNFIRVISFGSGLYPDYYALKHNLTTKFTYIGYDACNWPTTSLLPKSEDNIELIHESIDSLTAEQLSEYDVFIFPKSIGDIENSANLTLLGEKIRSTSKRKIYFLNSFIIKENINNNEQIALFDKIHQSLSNSGFSTNDDRKNTSHKGPANTALIKINNGFVYPPNISACSDKDEKCPDSCTVCHSPIFTNRYMGYQLLEYTK